MIDFMVRFYGNNNTIISELNFSINNNHILIDDAFINRLINKLGELKEKA